MQTIRAALDDTFNVNYTLTGPTINLATLAPTPTIEVDVIDAITGTVRTSIPCTIVAATSGIVSFNVEDATTIRSMNRLLFRIAYGATVQTVPTVGEQGLWVY